MTDSLRRDFRNLGLPQLKLYNSYGPTEITLSAVKVEVPNTGETSPDNNIPIGKPMPGYSIYILDENQKPVPAGIPGEIVIGGAGVSLGYFNQPDLTAEKFLNDPWAPPEHVKNGWTKMYRTGDKGRITGDGHILFHGRVEGDNQIKLRGIRIELEDIESTILKASNGALSDVVCTVRGERELLVAHATFSPSFSAEAEARSVLLKQLLTQLPLPAYMVPAAIFPLEKMCLTAHLKRDRATIAALPIVDSIEAADDVASDLGEMESQVKGIWQKVLPEELSRGPFTSSTDFFRVGGNSLLLVELQATIRATFDIAIPLVELFEVSTLGKMAIRIQEMSSLSKIDWPAETSPPDASSFAAVAPTPLRSRDMEVILTGITGHLGRHLLPLLLANPAIAKIHCIAVRNPSKLPITSAKLVIHTGDLTTPLLGLSPSTFATLASTADAIIHCAARRSFWEPYRVLRNPNVTSTVAVISLAGARKVPIHFLSSGGIASQVPESAAETFKPSGSGSEGYLSTKWVGEQMLEAANRRFYIPVHVYRTTSSLSKFTEMPEELLADFARTAVAINALPEMRAWSGTFDLVSVNAVAGGIVASVAGKDGEREGQVRFVHFPAIVRMGRVEQMKKFLEREEIKKAGRESFEVVPVIQWLGRMKGAGLGWMVASQDALVKGKIRMRR